jgi:hypothetical protein
MDADLNLIRCSRLALANGVASHHAKDIGPARIEVTHDAGQRTRRRARISDAVAHLVASDWRTMIGRS